MTSSEQSQKQYAIYRMAGKDEAGLIYYFTAGPYTDRKEAIHKAEEMNKSEPEVYFSYVVSEYKGESWSP
ncbi:MAG: hypothetical protein QNJ55_21740 [Xenococcus sp. MO_188.B8]|nr:hypothetical protein [Xenococcus sp. MO_188.B8]